MALIKCKECGSNVSDKAQICVHCGCPLIEKRYELRIRINTQEKIQNAYRYIYRTEITNEHLTLTLQTNTLWIGNNKELGIDLRERYAKYGIIADLFDENNVMINASELKGTLSGFLFVFAIIFMSFGCVISIFAFGILGIAASLGILFFGFGVIALSQILQLLSKMNYYLSKISQK